MINVAGSITQLASFGIEELQDYVSDIYEAWKDKNLRKKVIIRLLEEGKTQEEISEIFDVSTSVVSRYCKKLSGESEEYAQLVKRNISQSRRHAAQRKYEEKGGDNT